MFADTDFLLALVKESDWLKDNAAKITAKYRAHIRVSVPVMVELAMMCRKFKLNTKEIFASALEFADLDSYDYERCLDAAVYIEREGLNVFDAFHAAYCHNDMIISSDPIYERVGIDRIKLEGN